MSLENIDPIIFVVFIQILTESFPISSSGHVLLIERILNKFGIDLQTSLPSFFEHYLHGPTILILMLVFFSDWFEPVKRLIGGIFFQTKRDSYKRLCRIFFKIVGYVCVTTSIIVPAWVLQKFWILKQVQDDKGVYLKPIIVILNLFQNLYVNWFVSGYSTLFGFCATAILLFLLFMKEAVRLVRQAHHERIIEFFANLKDHNFDTLNIKKVLIIGLVQVISLLFGISRFASVYVTSRLLNISPRRAIQFTFYMLIPILLMTYLLVK